MLAIRLIGLLVFLMLARLDTASSCPETCTCWGVTRSVYCSRTINLQSRLPRGIPPVTASLTITHTTLKKIGPVAFTGIRFLNEIDFSHNRIETISDISFNYLRKLHTLNLDGNRIKLIPGRVFLHTRSLKKLSLNDNKILVLIPLNFEGLGALEELYLLRNPIMCLATNAFSGLRSLRRLEMSDMNATLESNLLSSLWELRELVIRSFHKVVSMPKDFFSNNTKLNKLYLENTRLTGGLSKDLLSPLRNLSTLSLRGCGLYCIPNEMLHPVRSSLTEMDLSHNPLKKIALEDFQDMENLKALNLRKCELKYIPKSALALPRLTTLDLSGNRLKTLEANVFGPIWPSYLRNVTLGNNPWLCDCRVKWMIERRLRHSSDISAVCAEPSNVQGKNIASGSKDEAYFQCKPPTIREFRSKKLSEDTVDTSKLISFDAVCKADGNPRPQIFWVLRRAEPSRDRRRRRTVDRASKFTWSKTYSSLQGKKRSKRSEDDTPCVICGISAHYTDKQWVSEDGTFHVRDTEVEYVVGEYTCVALNKLGHTSRTLLVQEDSEIMTSTVTPNSPQSVRALKHEIPNYFGSLNNTGYPHGNEKVLSGQNSKRDRMNTGLYPKLPEVEDESTYPVPLKSRYEQVARLATSVGLPNKYCEAIRCSAVNFNVGNMQNSRTDGAEGTQLGSPHRPNLRFQTKSCCGNGSVIRSQCSITLSIFQVLLWLVRYVAQS